MGCHPAHLIVDVAECFPQQGTRGHAVSQVAAGQCDAGRRTGGLRELFRHRDGLEIHAEEGRRSLSSRAGMIQTVDPIDHGIDLVRWVESQLRWERTHAIDAELWLGGA